jgi:hypothetical protein
MTLVMNALFVVSALAGVVTMVAAWLVLRALGEMRRAVDEIAERARWLYDIGQSSQEIAGHLTRAMQADQLAAAVDDEVRRHAAGGRG